LPSGLYGYTFNEGSDYKKRGSVTIKVLTLQLSTVFLMKVDKADIENQIVILQAMLNQVRFNNPKFKLFSQHQAGTTRIKGNPDEINKEIIRRLRIQNKQLLDSISVIKSQLKQIKINMYEAKKQLSDLQKMNNSLSLSLGSCNICWGENPECDNCSGNGSPGWRKVNKRLFYPHWKNYMG
jgi:hypothetical protein